MWIWGTEWSTSFTRQRNNSQVRNTLIVQRRWWKEDVLLQASNSVVFYFDEIRRRGRRSVIRCQYKNLPATQKPLMSCLSSQQNTVTPRDSSWHSNAQEAAALSIHEASMWTCGMSGRRQREMHWWWERPLHSVPRAGLSGGLQRRDISRSLHPPHNLPDHKRPFEDTGRRGRKHVGSKKKNWKDYRPGSEPSGNLSQPIWNLSTQVLPARQSRPLLPMCAASGG